jgi:hypothetical protein
MAGASNGSQRGRAIDKYPSEKGNPKPTDRFLATAPHDRSRLAALLQPIGDSKHGCRDGQDQCRERDGVNDLAIRVGRLGHWLTTRLDAFWTERTDERSRGKVRLIACKNELQFRHLRLLNSIAY